MDPTKALETSATTADATFRFDLQMFGDDDKSGDGDKGGGGDDKGGDSGDKGGDADKGGDKAKGDDEKVYTEAHVRRIHAENANRRKENEDLKSKLREHDENKLKEEKKLQELADKRATERDDAIAKAKAADDRIAKRAITTEIRDIAREAGIINPKVSALIEAKECAYDVDSDTVTGAKEAVAAFKEANPDLFKEPKGGKAKDDDDGKQRRGAPPERKDGDGEKKTIDFSKMTPKEWAAYKKAEGITA